MKFSMRVLLFGSTFYCTNRGRKSKTSFSAHLNACAYPYGISVRLVVYLHVAAARGSCEARI